MEKFSFQVCAIDFMAVKSFSLISDHDFEK